eukprot:scaffold126589_cov40-Phaeocystis_antarctica.AAC.1
MGRCIARRSLAAMILLTKTEAPPPSAMPKTGIPVRHHRPTKSAELDLMTPSGVSDGACSPPVPSAPTAK